MDKAALKAKANARAEREAKQELDAAIDKLKDNYKLGHQIQELLELGPKRKQARDGELRKAIDEVSVSLGRKLEIERARKLVEFTKKYTEKHLEKLVDDCEKYGYAPEFGVIIRLFPLSVSERNKLQKKAIQGRWKKTRLNQEIARKTPVDQLVDTTGRGRPPTAIKSLTNLTGEALIDARKWGRILHFLKQDKGAESVWSELSERQQKDLRSVAKTLLRLSQEEPLS